jgi:hypothetical protein
MKGLQTDLHRWNDHVRACRDNQVTFVLEQGRAVERHITGHDGNERIPGCQQRVIETAEDALPGLKI